jgi:hypothetical protein
MSPFSIVTSRATWRQAVTPDLHACHKQQRQLAQQLLQVC